MSGPRTRLAGRADIPAIAAIAAAMDDHYATPGALGVAGTAAALAEMGFPDTARFEVLLAEMPDPAGWQPAGLASLATLWPTSQSRRSCFLKDLFVLRRWRGQGLGRRLMAHAAALAHERGYPRLDWTADAAATATRQFYEGLGGMPRPDKVFFRLDGEALTALARTHVEDEC